MEPSLVTAPVVVGEVPRPVQAGLGAGRSNLRLSQVTEPYWGTDPRSHGLYRRQHVPLVPPVSRRTCFAELCKSHKFYWQ